jgi:uncharacterized membrane protein YdjX (TVP38/TMEM64 family)
MDRFADSIHLAPSVAPRSWRWIARGLALAAVVGLLVVVWLVWDHQAVMAWMREARAVPFFAIMAVLPAFGVPLTPLFILAGATFGRRVGLVGAELALVANLTACYWIARGGMQRWLKAALRKFGHELPDLSRKDKRAVRFIVGTKLAPGVPAFVKHYGLGAAGVPFPLYLGWSMLISGIYGALLVLVGESLLEHRFNRGVIVLGVLLALGIGIAWWQRRRAREG